MRGTLIVNGFLRTQKFEELYSLLCHAAKEYGVALQIRTSDCVLGELFEDKTTFLKEEKPDFCLFWDKDIRLARRLENLGIPLFNSASAVEICDDKSLTALALQKADLPTPKTFLVPKTFKGVGYGDFSFLKGVEETFSYPMVLKENCGSFGQQVYLVQNREETERILTRLNGTPCLLQEFIAESKGVDIRVNVVGNRAVCAMQRRNERDFRSNVTGGGVATKYALSHTEAELAVRACKAVGADFAGVDILFGKNGPLICEVNSNPHFKSTLDCTGVDLSREILRYIKERL